MTLASRTTDMRATATLSPVRKGKRRLLESCALAAGMVALAYGAPALAQVAGTGTIVSGGGTPNGVSGTTTTTTVTQAQNVINWVPTDTARSEEHTSELQSLMRNSYAVFCLKQKKKNKKH